LSPPAHPRPLPSFPTRRSSDLAREHARQADSGHRHGPVGGQLPWRERLTSLRAWSDVAHNFRGDWQMLWKEITVGFLLAGFIAQDRKSTRLNSSHRTISYAVFC